MIKPIFDKLENTDLSAAEKYGFLKKLLVNILQNEYIYNFQGE